MDFIFKFHIKSSNRFDLALVVFKRERNKSIFWEPERTNTFFLSSLYLYVFFPPILFLKQIPSWRLPVVNTIIITLVYNLFFTNKKISSFKSYLIFYIGKNNNVVRFFFNSAQEYRMAYISTEADDANATCSAVSSDILASILTNSFFLM